MVRSMYKYKVITYTWEWGRRRIMFCKYIIWNLYEC